MTHPHDREQRARQQLQRRRAAHAAQLQYPRARRLNIAGHITVTLGVTGAVFDAIASLTGAGMPPALQVVTLLVVACLITAVWLWFAARRAETRYRLGLYARQLRLAPRALPAPPPRPAVTATPAHSPAVITTMPDAGCRMPDRQPPPPTPATVTLENVTAT